MATKISLFFMRIVLSSVFYLHHTCLCWLQSSSLSCLHACCLAFFPPVFTSFLSYFFYFFLAFSLLLPASLLSFSCLSSLRPSFLSFGLSCLFLCFSVRQDSFSSRVSRLLAFFLLSFFCLSSFVIFFPSFFPSFLPSLFFQHYTPCILGFFFLPSLLSCFLPFFSHFLFSCFLAFPPLFLRSSSLPNNKSRGLWPKGALPALLCVLFRCHLVFMFSQDLSLCPILLLAVWDVF